jgi:hypothetical protein
MNDAVLYVVGVLLLFGAGYGLRWGAKHYANTQVSLAMLSVEKKLSTWAKEKASEGADKRQAAVWLISDRVYPLLPPIVKLFVSRDMLVTAIDKLYGQMLDYLD